MTKRPIVLFIVIAIICTFSIPSYAAQPDIDFGTSSDLVDNSYSSFFAKRPSQVLSLESNETNRGRASLHGESGVNLRAKANSTNIPPEESIIGRTLVDTLNSGFENGWLKSDSGKPEDIEATQLGIDIWRADLEAKFPPECFELNNIGASWKGWEVDIDLICSEERVNELMMERLAITTPPARPVEPASPGLADFWQQSVPTAAGGQLEDRQTQQDIPQLPWIEGREFWCAASLIGVAFGVIGVVAFLAMTGPVGALAWIGLGGSFFSIITGWIGMVINCTGILAAWNDPNRGDWQAAGSYYLDRSPQAWYECSFKGYYSSHVDGSSWKWDDRAYRWVPVKMTFNC